VEIEQEPVDSGEWTVEIEQEPVDSGRHWSIGKSVCLSSRCYTILCKFVDWTFRSFETRTE
jgi:hypothetical protein